MTRTKAPGASRTRSRSAAIGSSTAPVVPDSGRPSSAIGLAGDRSAAEEVRAIGLPLDGAAEPSVDAEHVKCPGGVSSGAARPPAEEQAGALGIVLGLDEQLAEGRMREIVLGTRQHDLGVARDLDLARPIAVIGDRQPAHLDVVLGRHRDLELRLEVAVARAERRLVELERRRRSSSGSLADGLVGRRPDGARPRIAQVDEVCARVRRAILALTRDREPAPRAEAAAGVRDRGRCSGRSTGTACAGWRCAATGSAATRSPGSTGSVVALSAGRGSDRMASRGTRSCSSSSVACTRGSAWKRVDEHVVAERRWRAPPATCPGDARRTPARSRAARRVAGAASTSRLRAPVVDRFVETEAAVEARAGQTLEVLRRGARIDQAASAVAYGAITRSSSRPRLKPSPGTPNALY